MLTHLSQWQRIISIYSPAGSDSSGLHRRLQLDCRRLCRLYSAGVERHAEEAAQGQVRGRYKRVTVTADECLTTSLDAFLTFLNMTCVFSSLPRLESD